MDKLRVGIIVYTESDPTEGGGHSYYDRLLKGINTFDFDKEIEIINIIFSKTAKNQLQLPRNYIHIRSAYKMYPAQDGSSSTSSNIKFALNRLFFKVFSYFRKKKIERILRQNRIDLVYYLKPEFYTLNYPFIATHWDVGHKSMFAFPEVSMNGEYELREKYYLYTLNKAFVVLCESETGAKELISYYSIYKDKIRIVPVFGGDIINLEITQPNQEQVLRKHHLDKDCFFFYPAQFWAHKNHYTLILAFYNFTREANRGHFKLVLCGSDKGNRSYIMQLVRSLSLEDRVIFPGFVNDEELYVFYKNAIALVMPTFLGPTNLPLIEAAHLNCAIICSDLEGHREILSDNALYFNPADDASLGQAMVAMLNTHVRSALIDSANIHIKNSSFNLNKSLHSLNRVLTETKRRRKVWGIDYQPLLHSVILWLLQVHQ